MTLQRFYIWQRTHWSNLRGPPETSLSASSCDTQPPIQFIYFLISFNLLYKRLLELIYHVYTVFTDISFFVFYVMTERVISFRKQSSISTQFPNWEASRAVDGDYRTLPSQCNCCTATKYQKDPYLRLNLTNVHRVTRISIYGRTDDEFDGRK